MPTGDVETYHQDGQWHNRIEGEDEDLGAHPTKEEAAAAGRTVAQERQVEHLIRKLDGSIGERNTYGHDPRDTPG